MTDRLYRSRRDRVLAGVCGGLAERYGADVSVIRVGWVLLAIASGGVLALVYLLMAIVIPEGPEGAEGVASGQGGASWGSAWTPGTSGAWTPGTSGAWTPGTAGAGTTRPTSSRNTSVVIGVLLIALGAWFLLDRYLHIRIDWDLVWPVVVIGLGVLLIAGAGMRRGRGSGGESG